MWPDDYTATLCLPIPPYVFNAFSSPIARALVVTTTILLVILVAVASAFIKYRKTRIVKATSFSHSVMILVAAAVAGADVFVICLLERNKINCAVSFAIFHLSISALFAPLLIKNIRVYRIFAAGKKGLRRPKFVTGKIQLVFIAIILSIQVIYKIQLVFFLIIVRIQII